jgi:hypothetical protein
MTFTEIYTARKAAPEASAAQRERIVAAMQAIKELQDAILATVPALAATIAAKSPLARFERRADMGPSVGPDHVHAWDAAVDRAAAALGAVLPNSSPEAAQTADRLILLRAQVQCALYMAQAETSVADVINAWISDADQSMRRLVLAVVDAITRDP